MSIQGSFELIWSQGRGPRLPTPPVSRRSRRRRHVFERSRRMSLSHHQCCFVDAVFASKIYPRNNRYLSVRSNCSVSGSIQMLRNEQQKRLDPPPTPPSARNSSLNWPVNKARNICAKVRRSLLYTSPEVLAKRAPLAERREWRAKRARVKRYRSLPSPLQKPLDRGRSSQWQEPPEQLPTRRSSIKLKHSLRKYTAGPPLSLITPLTKTPKSK